MTPAIAARVLNDLGRLFFIEGQFYLSEEVEDYEPGRIVVRFTLIDPEKPDHIVCIDSSRDGNLAFRIDDNPMYLQLGVEGRDYPDDGKPRVKYGTVERGPGPEMRLIISARNESSTPLPGKTLPSTAHETQTPVAPPAHA